MLPYVAIPSYKRASTISKKTLNFLKVSKYPVDRIHIFVANDEEYLDYKRLVPEDLYGEIIVGVKGLAEQRNFISSFYKEDEVLIQMDDDVISIKSEYPFITLVMMGVSSLYGRTAGLWGVLPNDDGRRFKNDTTKHLAHILGSFFIIRNHRDIKITYNEKEDMERSIKYFRRYGQVLRYQNAGVATRYAKGEGGLQMPGRLDRIKLEIARFHTEYPGYVTSVQKKGVPDIILNWRMAPPSCMTPETIDARAHLPSSKQCSAHPSPYHASSSDRHR
jgi:hypothetical protein